MRNSGKRVQPVITVHPVITNELPFGWGDGEPPTPEDEEGESNKNKNKKIIGFEETKDTIVFLGICHNVPNDQGNPSTSKS